MVNKLRFFLGVVSGFDLINVGAAPGVKLLVVRVYKRIRDCVVVRNACFD